MEFITQFSETPQRVKEDMAKETIVPVQSTFNEFCALFLKSLCHAAFPEEYPSVQMIGRPIGLRIMGRTRTVLHL